MGVWLSNAKSQMIFSEREVKIEATIRDAERIAQRTKGRVYWNGKGELDSTIDFYMVQQKISESIREKAKAVVEEKKEKEIVIDPDELDWEEINQVIKECEEKIKAEEEERKTEKQVKSLIAEKFKYIDVTKYSSVVIFKIDGAEIHRIYYNKNSELLDKLNKLSEEEILVKYIENLIKKYEDVKKQCKQREEEIIKRFYEEEKEITIEQPEQVRLRVTAEYPDDY